MKNIHFSATILFFIYYIIHLLENLLQPANKIHTLNIPPISLLYISAIKSFLKITPRHTIIHHIYTHTSHTYTTTTGKYFPYYYIDYNMRRTHFMIFHSHIKILSTAMKYKVKRVKNKNSLVPNDMEGFSI